MDDNIKKDILELIDLKANKAKEKKTNQETIDESGELITELNPTFITEDGKILLKD